MQAQAKCLYCLILPLHLVLETLEEGKPPVLELHRKVRAEVTAAATIVHFLQNSGKEDRWEGGRQADWGQGSKIAPCL